MWAKIEAFCAAIANISLELVYSPLNLILVSICLYLLYNILRTRKETVPVAPPTPQLPVLKKKDMTVEELKVYDGTGPEGRVLIAVNGKVFDVTRSGKRFYGPGIICYIIIFINSLYL